MFDCKTPFSQNILEDSSYTDIIWGFLVQKQRTLDTSIFVGLQWKDGPESGHTAGGSMMADTASTLKELRVKQKCYKKGEPRLQGRT